MDLHSIKAKVEKSLLDLEASFVLSTTWVKVCGIPLLAKTDELVKDITSTIGEPLEIDEISLMYRSQPRKDKGRLGDEATSQCLRSTKTYRPAGNP